MNLDVNTVLEILVLTGVISLIVERVNTLLNKGKLGSTISGAAKALSDGEISEQEFRDLIEDILSR